MRDRDRQTCDSDHASADVDMRGTEDECVGQTRQKASERVTHVSAAVRLGFQALFVPPSTHKQNKQTPSCSVRVGFSGLDVPIRRLFCYLGLHNDENRDF